MLVKRGGGYQLSLAVVRGLHEALGVGAAHYSGLIKLSLRVHQYDPLLLVLHLPLGVGDLEPLPRQADHRALVLVHHLHEEVLHPHQPTRMELPIVLV